MPSYPLWSILIAGVMLTLGLAVHPVNADSYLIIAAHSGKCLEVPDSRQEDGANVVQNDCHAGSNQQWLIESSAEGKLRFRTVHSGKCLDVAGGSTADQANVQQYRCHQGANQQWALVPVDDRFRIVSLNSGKCLDVANASTVSHANVQQNSCHQGANQLFALTPVGR